MGDTLIKMMPDPLSAVLLFFLIALGGVVLAMARYVAGLHERSLQQSLDNIKIQEGLKGTLDGMSHKLDASSALDQQMVIALTELKATLK